MIDAQIKISVELFGKAEQYARRAGYASVDEFISHILEKELAKLDEAEAQELIKERLKNLGYLS